MVDSNSTLKIHSLLLSTFAVYNYCDVIRMAKPLIYFFILLPVNIGRHKRMIAKEE